MWHHVRPLDSGSAILLANGDTALEHDVAVERDPGIRHRFGQVAAVLLPGLVGSAGA